MSAYVIVDIDVTDAEAYKEYVRLAPATVSLYGGRYLARGGKTETLEGDWQAKRLVILEFEKPRPGSIRLNTRLSAPCVIVMQRPIWSWWKVPERS